MICSPKPRHVKERERERERDMSPETVLKVLFRVATLYALSLCPTCLCLWVKREEMQFWTSWSLQSPQGERKYDGITSLSKMQLIYVGPATGNIFFRPRFELPFGIWGFLWGQLSEFEMQSRFLYCFINYTMGLLVFPSRHLSKFAYFRWYATFCVLSLLRDLLFFCLTLIKSRNTSFLCCSYFCSASEISAPTGTSLPPGRHQDDPRLHRRGLQSQDHPRVVQGREADTRCR